MTEILRIPKQTVLVDLALAGAEPRPVEILLAEQLAREFRRQHVLDLLEEPVSFFPARDSASGAWEIVNKRWLLWIRLGSGEEVDEELFDVAKKIRVDLQGGAPLEGELLHSEESARVSDYLNLPGRFFRLWEGEHLYLVNKSFVLRIVETGKE